jgi:co-chaperonin GroES (HSP10)
MKATEVKNLVTIDAQPRGGRILVVPFLKATSGTIIDTAENTQQLEPGVVVAIGPTGYGPESGRPIPVLSKEGDVVYYGKFSGQPFDLPGPRGPVPALVMDDAFVQLARAGDDYDVIIHDNNPRKMHAAGLKCEHCEPDKIDLAALKTLAGGTDDVIDAEVKEDDDEKAQEAIEAERARLHTEREDAERA